MPEAPEVQTVLKTLETQIKDVLIEDVFVYYPKIIDNVDIDVFKNHVIGQSFRSFDRIGKYLIFGLDDYDLVVHLRMEGKFYLYDKLQNDKHIHVVLKLNNQTFMSYHDTRKFGRMYLYPKKEDIHSYACFKNVGYDYMDEKVNGMYFYNCIHSLKRNLKSCLLDQSIMAGVGNIYADEKKKKRL